MKIDIRKSFKAINQILVLLVFANIILIGCASSSFENQSQSIDTPQAFNVDELNNYGQWVEIPNYGRVWKPFVAPDWEPFHNGHWIRSGNDWVWVSYEPFGWIVYHYGNWYDDFIQGWVWIPSNTEWSPAVVQWYQKDDYICWAPIPPRGVNYGNPWEESERRHWHVVTKDHFTDENIGEISQTYSHTRNSGERNYSPPSVRENKSAGENKRDRTTNSSPGKDVPNVYLVPLKESKSPVITKPPIKQEIENRIGKKIENVPITKEPVKLKEREINKVVVPEPIRNRIEKYERNVKNNVLAVPRSNNEKKKDEKPQK